MATRGPFQYGSGCSGPVVSTGNISFLPICTFPVYPMPTVNMFHIDMSIPDLAPPPLCPCIGSFGTRVLNVSFLPIDTVTGAVKVNPAGGGNCCEPSFNMSLNLQMPCMPFTTSHYAHINVGKVSVNFAKCSGQCKLDLDINISLPPIFSGACMPWDVQNNAGTINVGNFNFSFEAAKASCLLKAKGKISLPFTIKNFIDSVSIAGNIARFHWVPVKCFSVGTGGSTTWATLSVCPPP